MQKPERLWLHYGFAMTLFFGLVIGAYMVNATAVNRNVIASQGIKQSNLQNMQALEIFQMSGALGLGNTRETAQFTKKVNQFAATHRLLIEEQVSTPVLQAHFFDTERPLNLRVDAFVDAARQSVTGTEDSRVRAVSRLRNLYTTGGLGADLRTATTLFSERVEAESHYFAGVQRVVLFASVFVLLAEIIFVFWPAHYMVQSTMNKMKRQASVLKSSEKRLALVNGQLDHMVHHSALTGLPNRASLTDSLANAIAQQQTTDSSLMLVGLDNFKSVNDMIGHDYGDALLVAVSGALQACVDYDSIVAHVGGDEFVLISQEPSPAIVGRIKDALTPAFDIKGRRISVNASVGYLLIGDTAQKPMDILADAEIALQCAKNAGGNRAQEYTLGLREDMSLLQKLQLDLRDAIENGEIEPWFQPQVRLSDGTLHGAEVLARWRHPTRGLLTPDKFLPAAERAGLMVDLDHAVWGSAMGYALSWQNNNIWRPCISLNAAPDTISDPHLVERFLFALQRSGLSVDQVIVEVLETTLINGKDDMAAINIDSLAECGIALELDDFGTGYASLSKLTQLPLAGIKLDRSLIAPLPDQGADSVVRAILALAAELGLNVIAEGVEENEQAIHLNERGCEFGQGYGFGKPMPPDEFAIWLGKNAQSTVLAGQAAELTQQRA